MRHDFILRGILAATAAGQTTGLSFSRGLNIVSGVSNTGKSYAVRCIDYMLGGEASSQKKLNSKPPLRNNPYIAPYQDLLLGIERSDGIRQTLRRPVGGGHARLVEADVVDAVLKSSKTQLTQKHHPTNQGNISAYLLGLCGLRGRQIRKNAAGEMQSVSIRNVVKFNVIQESEIFKDAPLFLTGQHTTAVFEARLFRMLLTGQDDNSGGKRRGNKSEQLKATVESRFLDGLIDENRRDLAHLNVPADPAIEMATIDSTIAQRAKVAAATRQQIVEVERARQSRWKDREADRVRLDTTQGLLARFGLLRQQYRSDLERLNALIELNTVIDHFPSQTCPYCGTEPKPMKATNQEGGGEFLKAAEREKEKVALRAQELGDTIRHLEMETVRLRERIGVLGEEVDRYDNELENSLRPQRASQSGALEQLLTRRTALAQAVFLSEQIATYDRKRKERTTAVGSSTQATTNEQLFPSTEIRKLCEIMSELLIAWKFPGDGSVRFDHDTQDFLASGLHRADHGKGLKAVIYAAFAIGLMMYCRGFDLPHPGFVVLDSPLVTFQEKDVPENEVITLTLKDAFFTDLADRIRDCQVIIFDNEQVPPSVIEKVQYVRFTGNPELDRPGFLEPVGVVLAP